MARVQRCILTGVKNMGAENRIVLLGVTVTDILRSGTMSFHNLTMMVTATIRN